MGMFRSIDAEMTAEVENQDFSDRPSGQGDARKRPES